MLEKEEKELMREEMKELEKNNENTEKINKGDQIYKFSNLSIIVMIYS